MKKRVLFILLFIVGIFSLVSCLGDEKESFIISSSSNEYLLDKKTDSSYKLTFSVNESSNLKKHLKNDVVYYIDGDNSCEAVMVNDSFTATKEGKVIVKARIDDLISKNSIEINVKYSDSYIAESEEDIASKLEEISKKTIDFGSVIDLGINASSANMYYLSGCDDVMFINDNGQLEVCGVMLSTEVTLHSNVTNKNIWTGYLSSTFGTILATSVKNELVSNNIISKTQTTITKNHMAQVKKLNLDGLISNDVTSINGIKWLTNLEELDLSNNGIDNIDFASGAKNLKRLIVNNNNIQTLEKLKQHINLEYLNISNNLIKDLDYVHRFTKLKYLDISSNGISDITNVGNLINIESLFLNNNKLTVFKDALSALNNLKELGLGNCGLTFKDVKSIQFIDKANITYLDLSGTNVNLDNVVEFGNLNTLILENSNLVGADISKLNALSKLKYLDISNNSLNKSSLCSSNNGVLKFKLDANFLRSLDTLCLGENEFSELPDLSSFVYLNTLDLTNSYNLKSLDSLGKLNIKELILDECNSIKIDDDGTKYLNALSKENLPNLEKLSITSGLNYMTKDLYEKITSRVKNGDFKLKFINEEYIDKDTIYNYSQSIFFSMEEFLTATTIREGEATNIEIIPATEEIILSLVNDRTSTAKARYYFYIPSNLSKFSIFGNEYDIYNIGFNVMERKQSSITFEFSSFIDKYTGNESLISTEKGARTIINSFYECSLASENKNSVLDLWDLNIKVKSGKLSVYTDYVPNKPPYVPNQSGIGNYIDSYGNIGYNGVTAIKGNIIILQGSLNVKGGNGGNGGDSESGWANAYGGNGGSGGNAILYYTSLNFDSNTVELKGGAGGSGGIGKNMRMGSVAGTNYGSKGEDGKKYEKHE